MLNVFVPELKLVLGQWSVNVAGSAAWQAAELTR
jgi:hypothetical protein